MPAETTPKKASRFGRREANRLLLEITVPVMGCTEPAAIALAAALAAAAARGRVPEWVGDGPPPSAALPQGAFDLEMLQVRTVRSLYKNALAVGIPNADGGSGIYLAAALGPYLDPDDRLNLLKGCNPTALEAARKVLGEGLLGLEAGEETRDGVFVEAQIIGVWDGERHVGEAVLRETHDGVTLLRQDGRTLFKNTPSQQGASKRSDLGALQQCDLPELIRLSTDLEPACREHLLAGVSLNRQAAQVGLEQRLGLGVGAQLASLMERGELADDVSCRASMMTAAATDARMSGHDVEVMSSSGSGNQGIMAVLPVAMVAEHVGADEDRLAEAVALAHLVTAVMTRHTGLLSALCGCVVKAGLGAAAGVARIQGLDAPGIFAALQNMAGNMTGEICDGAKVGCAVKLCTAARAAVLSGMLARDGVTIPANNGILAASPEVLFTNIGEVARSMREVDRAIVGVMERKQLRTNQ